MSTLLKLIKFESLVSTIKDIHQLNKLITHSVTRNIKHPLQFLAMPLLLELVAWKHLLI